VSCPVIEHKPAAMKGCRQLRINTKQRSLLHMNYASTRYSRPAYIKALEEQMSHMPDVMTSPSWGNSNMWHRCHHHTPEACRDVCTQACSIVRKYSSHCAAAAIAGRILPCMANHSTGDSPDQPGWLGPLLINRLAPAVLCMRPHTTSKNHSASDTWTLD
jgi:hypothetical protein